jgi:hypothetical protein
MGGFGKLIGDAIGEIGDQMFSGFGRFLSNDTAAYGFSRSGEALLRKSKAGDILADYIKQEFEPAVGKTGQQLLQTKLQPGMLPHQATQVLRTMGRDATNLNRKLYFGNNDELIIKAIAEGTKQRGPAYGSAMADVMSSYFREANSSWRQKKVGIIVPGARLSLTDLGIRGTNKFVTPHEWEEGLRRSYSWMFTQGIAIPHLSQIVNPILREGVTNTAKALSEWTEALVKTGRPDKAFHDIIESGLLFDEFRYEALADAKTPGASLATKLFNHPGFNWVRRQQITIAALAGKNHFLNAVAELRNGVNTQMNEFTLRRLGVDVAALRGRNWQILPEDMQSAMYQAGVQNMFVRSDLDLPWKWDENFPSRLASQFKQFGFRQTKFLAETFRDAYLHGGPTKADKIKNLAKTTAVFGIFFPVAGEFVKQLESIAVGKGFDNPFGDDKTLGGEYFDAIGHAAGWGIFSSMFRSGQRGYIRGAFEGPLLTSTEDFYQAGVDIKEGLKLEYEDDPEKAERKFKAAGRLTIGKMGLPGRIISNKFLKNEDKE